MSKFCFATAESIRDEMAAIVELAGDPAPGDPVKVWLHRAARRLGITYSKAFRIRYQRSIRLDAETVDNMRARRRELLEAQAERAAADLAELKQKLRELDDAADVRLSAKAFGVSGVIAAQIDDTNRAGDERKCANGGSE
jgi:hypothetical protein